MKYISMAAGFVLATALVLGARAELPAHLDDPEFDIARGPVAAVFGGLVRIIDRRGDSAAVRSEK